MAGAVWLLIVSGRRESTHQYTAWRSIGLFPVAAMFEPAGAWKLLLFSTIGHTLMVFVLVSQRILTNSSGAAHVVRCAGVFQIVLLLVLVLGGGSS